MKPRLILDQDDVLADTYLKLADMVVAEFNTGLRKEDFYKQSFQELLSKSNQKKLMSKIHEPGFFMDIPVVPHAPEAVRELSEKYDIFVATAAMEFPNSFREKYDWLQRNFPFIHWKNIIFLGDKSILQGDWLIDDMAYNLATFTGNSLLFSTTQNRHETSYRRVQDWNEILKILM